MRTKCEQTVAGWRKIAREAHGHLRVLRVDDDFHGAVQFFDDPPAPALALMRRLKATFDPLPFSIRDASSEGSDFLAMATTPKSDFASGSSAPG